MQHTTEESPYIDEHKVQLRRQYPDRSEAWLARAHMKGFNIWFRDRIQKSDTCYDINGYTFYTTTQDKKSTYQNSGVRIEAVDNEEEKTTYYGQI